MVSHVLFCHSETFSFWVPYQCRWHIMWIIQDTNLCDGFERLDTTSGELLEMGVTGGEYQSRGTSKIIAKKKKWTAHVTVTFQCLCRCSSHFRHFLSARVSDVITGTWHCRCAFFFFIFPQARLFLSLSLRQLSRSRSNRS